MATARKTSRKSSTTSISSSVGPTVSLEWEPVVPLGPRAAFHIGAVIRGALYVHGGILESGSTKPSNQLFRMDLTSTMWAELRTPGSPALSHHAAVVSEDRYLILIGGWDGKRRTADVNVFDAQEDKWLKMEHTGFPEGAGLSSHTACQLINGDVIIVGREGSLRIQKKHGNVFILSGNVLSGAFRYREYSREATSRSGHTADIVGNEIFIIGGRDDKLLEKAQGFKGTARNQCSVISKILETLHGRLQSPMSKLPCGRKNHITAAGGNCLLVHGGETFDGRSREPVGEMFLISLKSPTVFYKLNTSVVGRAGHVCFVLPNKVLFHGGLSGKSTVLADLYQLKIMA
ncbi:kelch domain-containing protein 9 [Aplysia californica]|uniref:Kelch domain-containing protein 9 n=1 Tax=Aplysia californica TaxID=6500 RepID=A0ABM0JRD2_APLCA|nr:kelch domain-containing protein 9 [Aplysia californica]